METNIEVESPESGGSEAGTILAVILLVISLGVHLVLMYTCQGYAFAPMSNEAKAALAKTTAQKWTNQVPKMQVRKVESVDPIMEAMGLKPRPAAAPVQEKTEQKVERLAPVNETSVAPELPKSASLAPTADAAPAPAAVEAATWQPRQEIAVVESPVVPDEQAALPRLVIPKVERVKAAADIVPAYDLIDVANGTKDGVVGGTGTGKPVSLTSVAAGGAAAGAPVAPAAVPPAAGLPGGIGDPTGSFVGMRPPTLKVLSAAEEAAAKKAADDARAAEKAGKAAERLKEAAKPVPPAPTSTTVDEKVVAKEKEAVRVLRDETTVEGRPFRANVKLVLGSYVDPQDPLSRYFRITVASNPDNALPVVAKDIVFLLDASGSIANDRLKKCRAEIVKGLRMLNTGDRFNVIAFRDQFTFAFPDAEWKEVTEANLKAAENWMDRLTAHGQTDVFRTLRGILSMHRVPERPVIALVITDADATSGVTRSAEIISKFAHLNDGLVSIYMYGVKDLANAYLMDMVALGSRGGWAKNTKYRWFAGEGIPTLAKKFERPVLTDISTLFASSSNAEVYPRLVPHLAMDGAVEIWGKCPANQKELVFTMRGLNKATVYEELFRLSFDQAQPLDATVRQQWAEKRMHALVAAYTIQPDAKLMQEIRAFAARYQVAIPYEKEIRGGAR